MHIPDGFLNLPTAITACAISAIGIGFAVRQANHRLNEKHIPLMGVMAAGIFAAQMLNFPIVGGTSGHFVGAALAAIFLGPWAALLVMSSILIVQCLLFQDGGLLALGANIFNMGIVGCFAGFGTYKAICYLLGGKRQAILVGGFVAAWLSVVLSAAACASELAISGTSPWQVALPAMAGIHSLIGIGEGAITVAVLSLVLATRKDLLEMQKV